MPLYSRGVLIAGTLLARDCSAFKNITAGSYQRYVGQIMHCSCENLSIEVPTILMAEAYGMAEVS